MLTAGLPVPPAPLMLWDYYGALQSLPQHWPVTHEMGYLSLSLSLRDQTQAICSTHALHSRWITVLTEPSVNKQAEMTQLATPTPTLHECRCLIIITVKLTSLTDGGDDIHVYWHKCQLLTVTTSRYNNNRLDDIKWKRPLLPVRESSIMDVMTVFWSVNKWLNWYISPSRTTYTLQLSCYICFVMFVYCFYSLIFICFSTFFPCVSFRLLATVFLINLSWVEC